MLLVAMLDVDCNRRCFPLQEIPAAEVNEPQSPKELGQVDKKKEKEDKKRDEKERKDRDKREKADREKAKKEEEKRKKDDDKRRKDMDKSAAEAPPTSKAEPAPAAVTHAHGGKTIKTRTLLLDGQYHEVELEVRYRVTILSAFVSRM